MGHDILLVWFTSIFFLKKSLKRAFGNTENIGISKTNYGTNVIQRYLKWKRLRD